MAEVANLGDELKQAEAQLEGMQISSCRICWSSIPNMPHAACRWASPKTDNLEVRKVGKPPKFDFAVKDHVDLGEGLGLLDFDTAAKISGARFSLLKGPLARLHRALAQFMLDTHTASTATPRSMCRIW